tara:strand:- start:12963 stop:13673 length:711 start_codon:yes stop_codon:yes gene_type:complete
MLFSINYTYYENADLFKDLVAYYEPYKNQFEFNIIDDGSQKEPLSRDIVPSWWNLYRIEEDYGWGNEICKNILIKRSRSPWCIVLDLDYVIDLRTVFSRKFYEEDFKAYYGDTINMKIAFQFRDVESEFADHFRRINCYIVSHSSFNQTYGYDMAYGWTCGYDRTFFEQLDVEITAPARLIHIREKASPTATQDFSLYKALVIKYAREGLITKDRKWKSEIDRLNRCVELPEIITL